jgi:hypothetical protein
MAGTKCQESDGMRKKGPTSGHANYIPRKKQAINKAHE